MAIKGLGSEWIWLYPNKPNPYKVVETRTAYNTATGATRTVRQVYQQREEGLPPSLDKGQEENVKQRERLTTRSGSVNKHGDYISIEFRSFQAAANFLYNNRAVAQMLEKQGYARVQVGVAFQSSTDPSKNKNYPRQKNKTTNKIVGYGLRHAFIGQAVTIKDAYSKQDLYNKNVNKIDEFKTGEHGRYYVFISQY